MKFTTKTIVVMKYCQNDFNKKIRWWIYYQQYAIIYLLYNHKMHSEISFKPYQANILTICASHITRTEWYLL